METFLSETITTLKKKTVHKDPLFHIYFVGEAGVFVFIVLKKKSKWILNIKSILKKLKIKKKYLSFVVLLSLTFFFFFFFFLIDSNKKSFSIPKSIDSRTIDMA